MELLQKVLRPKSLVSRKRKASQTFTRQDWGL
jgi:hypothetical protein